LFLAQGALAIQRLDAIVALFLGLSLWFAARRQGGLAGAAFGFAGAAKVLPILAFPAFAASLEAERSPDGGRRRRAVVGAALGFALGFAPFAVAPAAAARMLRYHGDRGLHAESTLGIVLGIGRRLAGRGGPAPASFGSQNLEGPAADACARACTPLLLIGSVALAFAVYRRTAKRAGQPQGPEDSVAAVTLAATALLWLTSKVLSPQYLTWGIPLVLAVPGRAGVRLSWILAAALGVTQLYTRGFFDLVVAQAPIALFTLAVRQALLVALFVVALREALGARGDVPPAGAGAAA
jgi:uncharacterized membrane protein